MSEKSNCAIAVIGSDIGNRKTAAQCLNYSIRSVVPQWVIFDGFSRDSLLADVRSRSRSSSGGGQARRIVFGRMPVIQAPKLGLRIMRYELADFEWAALKPMLPNKPRGVPRVNDRRVLNGIFWVLRSGAPWRDLPEAFGPYTTCYNRFVR